MSPISFHTFRTIPSTLDLNGPYLSFSKQPVSAATTSGSSLELTGIATVSFLENTSPNNTGIITYKWYESGIGPLVEGSNVTGTATTVLTLSNLESPADNLRKFFLRADYVPSQETGNAVNEPLDSNETTITVYPEIEIIAQPTDASTLVNTNVSFTVNASLTDASFSEGLAYQWSINGQDVTDGVLVFEVPATKVEQTFSSPATHEIPASGRNVELTLAGAGGGNGGTDAGGGGGGAGAGRVGTFTYSNGPRTLDIYIGSKGGGGGSGNNDVGGAPGQGLRSGGKGGGAGPGGWSGGGGGGGALSAIYDRATSGYTIVAGGGGGGGGASLFVSGNGASPAGTFNANNGPVGINNGAQGNTKTSGDGGGGGAGGAGVSGGGPGSPGNDRSSGGTGGGGGTSGYDSNRATLINQSTTGDNGYGFIKYDVPDGTGTETITTNITISGSQTDTLTLSADAVGVSTVACRVSHPTATNSPVTSEDARFVVLDNANNYVINVEGINDTDPVNLSTTDLFNGELTLETSTPQSGNSVSANYWVLYAPDKDIDVEMDLYGGKGSNNGSFVGGEGGFSRIRFTMERNTEYVVTGLNSTIKSPFLYRKGTLIASVGAGGDAGTSFNGGFGGGIGVDGQDGFGAYGGNGGQSVTAGTLSLDGIFGSLFSSITPVDNDTNATGTSGGRTVSCTKGVYYRNQGVAPCTDVGSVQFRQSDGTLVANTASITRGFKAGYSVQETIGAPTTNGGRGGAGATGGDGGEQGSGGGGGSGYTDGSVTVVSAILGGSNSVAKVVLRVVT